MWGLCIFAANQSFMKKKLPITKNKDVVVSWVYTWSKQQDMSIHEQRIVLRILEACQAELKGVKLKDYAGTKRKFEHGLWDVDAQMHVSDVIFSGRDYNEIIAALDSLAGRFYDLKDISEDLAALDGFRDNDAGNALVVGLLRIETEGVVIPRPLNKDLIFVETVRSMRTA